MKNYVSDTELELIKQVMASEHSAINKDMIKSLIEEVEESRVYIKKLKDSLDRLVFYF